MAKQPFYHRAVILFTVADNDLSRDEVTEILLKGFKGKGIIKGSPECESVDAEPGDPHDL